MTGSLPTGRRTPFPDTGGVRPREPPLWTPSRLTGAEEGKVRPTGTRLRLGSRGPGRGGPTTSHPPAPLVGGLEEREDLPEETVPQGQCFLLRN